MSKHNFKDPHHYYVASLTDINRYVVPLTQEEFIEEMKEFLIMSFKTIKEKQTVDIEDNLLDNFNRRSRHMGELR